MTTSAQKNQTEISNPVENLSDSSSPQMLSFLKIIEYLSLAAFVGVCILTRVFPDNQPILSRQYIAILNQLQTNRASLIVIKLVSIQAFLQKSHTYITL
jgi:hypothetical protein